MAEVKRSYNNFFVTEDDLQYIPPYLKDTGETPNEVTCETRGAWPKWLRGNLARVGMGKAVVPLSEDGSKPNAVMQHFFDGLGMLHKFRFADGKVHYMSRSNTKGVERNAKRDGYVRTHMFGLNANTPLKDAQDPCSALLGPWQSLYIPEHDLEPDEFNMQVVIRRAFHLPPSGNPKDKGTPASKPDEEELILHTDFNMLQICDAKSLEPKRLLNYGHIDADLKGVGICAHPPKDRKRQWIFNYLIDPGEQTLYTFALDYGSNPARNVWKTALPCQPCYVHSLAMSENYVIFIRNPITMNTSDLTKPFSEMLEVEKDANTLFFVMEKETGKHAATYSGPHFMFFHAVNAYDFVDPKTAKTKIHVDLCSYEAEHTVYSEYSFANIVDPGGQYQDGRLMRYELDDVTNHKVPTSRPRRATCATGIPGLMAELPRINKAYSCVPGYRYVYACHTVGGPAPGTKVPIGRLGNGLRHVSGAFYGGIAKGDWKTGKYISWEPRDGESCPCEPVFVARPGASEEDDGVVLTIIINQEGTHSILIALDGKNLEEVARADMPQVYGLGPHGTFIESKGMY